jgi:hypothetical protein
MEPGKILKVTIEFENEILSVEGSEAEKWNERISVAESLLHTRSYITAPQINWKRESKP